MSRQSLVEHIPGLRRYARALTADAWAADDLVQDTLERACSRWRLWLAGSDLRAWLFTVMHNLFISEVRQLRRRADWGNSVDLDAVAHELHAPATEPGDLMDLQRCLMQLPPNQRAVLLLITLEDMSYTEVAKVTGVPVGTVMSRLSRARERMRALMDVPTTAPVAQPAPVVHQTPSLRVLK
jgi:RNA polymerase sigma-70 factor (ECF subfamily)